MVPEDMAQVIRQALRCIQPDKLPQDHAWPGAAHFRDDFGLDSLDLVEMVARLEQQWQVFVPDADLPLLSSVDATVAHAQRLLAAQGHAGQAAAPGAMASTGPTKAFAG